MNSSKIVDSNIINSDMTGANLYSADLSKTRIDNVKFQDTVFCKTIMPSGERDNSGCKHWYPQPKLFIVPYSVDNGLKIKLSWMLLS